MVLKRLCAAAGVVTLATGALADVKRSTAADRKEVSITVSIGVAARNHRHSRPDQVIRAADQALYVAKEQGRNRLRS